MIPFPSIPDSVKNKYHIKDLWLRPFGQFEDDLKIDFDQEIYPGLVTRILMACTQGQNGSITDEEFFWNLTVGKRIECLLFIVASGGIDALDLQVRCSNEACNQLMEITLQIEELSALQNRCDDDFLKLKVSGKTVRIRKPTGRDQLDWLKGSFQDEDAAIRSMIETLLHVDLKTEQSIAIDQDWVNAVDEAMTDFDPLVWFNLKIRCPHCDHEDQYEYDLEKIALKILHQSQLDLLNAIHRLAVHYHWSEHEILSIPSWRRSYYLALIDKREKL